jgi:hypothetical protein
MKRFRSFIAGVLVTLVASWSLATPVILTDHTAVNVRLKEDLSSESSQQGELVRYVVTSDVLDANGKVLIAKGATATGKIVELHHRDMFGKPGKLRFSIDSVRAVDGTEVPLLTTKSARGQSNAAAVWISALLLVWPTIFINGRDTVVPAGTEYAAYVDGETRVDPAKALNADTSTASVPAP